MTKERKQQFYLDSPEDEGTINLYQENSRLHHHQHHLQHHSDQPPTPPSTSPPSDASDSGIDTLPKKKSSSTSSPIPNSPSSGRKSLGARFVSPESGSQATKEPEPREEDEDSDTSTWVSRNRRNRRRGIGSDNQSGSFSEDHAPCAAPRKRSQEVVVEINHTVEGDSESFSPPQEQCSPRPPLRPRRISTERQIKSPVEPVPRVRRISRETNQDHPRPDSTPYFNESARPREHPGQADKIANGRSNDVVIDITPRARKSSGSILKIGSDKENVELQDCNNPGRVRRYSREILGGTPVETIKEDSSEADNDSVFASSTYRDWTPPNDQIRIQGASSDAEDPDPEEIVEGPGLTLTDEEFQQNYLGNLPTRKPGAFVYQPRSQPTSPTNISVSTAAARQYRRSVSETSPSKRISFDFTNQGLPSDQPVRDDFHVRRNQDDDNEDEDDYTTRDNSQANGLRPTQSVPDLRLNERYKRARRFSQTSVDTLASRASSTGSDGSLSKTVAAHVRRDSIALFSDKQHGNPLKRTSQKLVADLEQLRKNHTHLSRKEILTKYRLHIFVAIIFFITLLFVSLGWYYRDKTREEDLTNQKIFIDPRKRVLTLSDHHDEINVLLGQDLPKWQLPLHCPVLTAGNPNSKECEWKNNAVLRVQYFVADIPDSKDTAQCYNVSWQTLRPPRVPYDCFDVGTAVWYGPSNQSAETLPIRGSFEYVPTPYHLSNAGTLSSVVDLYWLSSSGVGLLLNPNDPLTLHWNTTVPNHLCVVSNYTGPLYGQTDSLPHMNYTLCNGPDPVKTHRLMKSFIRGSREASRPSDDMFGLPQWSVSGISRKTDYNQLDVRNVMMRLKLHKLNCSLVMLDGDWQQNHGDLAFDPDRFANLTIMTDFVTDMCNLGLQVSPYFDYRSVENFHDGVNKELFVKDAGGKVPGLTLWQNGLATAMLDVSLGSSQAWFNTLITRLLKDTNAKALRVSFGTEGWLPYKPTFSQQTLSLFQLKSQLSDMMSKYSNRLMLEHTAGSQHLHGFLTVSTDIAVRNGRSCLVNTIEKALTLGLLGYPYILADGFSVPHGGQSFNNFQPSHDLFTRWMQMVAFFPAYKFSVPPWIYNEETVQLAGNLSKLHIDLITKAVLGPELRQDTEQGLPIMRPVWWLDAANHSVHAMHVHDEFLVGNSLLVAPVLCEGVTQRAIYVPRGVWKDKLRGAIVLGPKRLEDYRVELHEVPFFERMPVYDDLKQ